ncbi:MAG: hypothetical protein ACK58T_30140, partial [Phycisphaerae bacterium]
MLLDVIVKVVRPITSNDLSGTQRRRTFFRPSGLTRISGNTDAMEARALLTTIVWDGGGADAYWTTPENWADDVLPVANDQLVFPVNAAQKVNENNFPAGFDFGSILIAGSNYNLSGNAIDLSGSVTSSGSSNSFAIPVTLGSSG